MERHNLKKENSPSQERISDTSHINSLKTLCFSFLICEMRNNCGCLAGLPCRLHKEPFCDLWPGPSRACGKSCLALQPNFGMPRERTWFSTFSRLTKEAEALQPLPLRAGLWFGLPALGERSFLSSERSLWSNNLLWTIWVSPLGCQLPPMLRKQSVTSLCRAIKRFLFAGCLGEESAGPSWQLPQYS